MNERGEIVGDERGASAVAGRKGSSSTLRYLMMAALLLGGGAAIVSLAVHGDQKKKEPPPKPLAGSQMQAYVPPPSQPASEQASMFGPPSAAAGEAAADKAVLVRGRPCPPGQAGCPVPKSDPMELARKSPVLVYQRAGLRGSGTAAEPVAAALAPPPQSDRNELQARLSPTVLTATQASQLKNRNLTLARGSIIECVLERAIDSTLPGFTSCSVPRDILSDNGRVIVLEKGTQIVGEYQGGLRQGQRRVFVLWTRAKTPEGIVIDLASPASDALGRTGFDGDIDNHFWDRFGAALLLSIVDDATATGGEIATNATSANGNNTTIQTGGLQAAGKQGAAIAVANSVKIPPTLYKNQGEVVAVQVARDLDFSTVYSLELRN